MPGAEHHTASKSNILVSIPPLPSTTFLAGFTVRKCFLIFSIRHISLIGHILFQTKFLGKKSPEILMLIIVRYACSNVCSHMYVLFSLAGHEPDLIKDP